MTFCDKIMFDVMTHVKSLQMFKAWYTASGVNGIFFSHTDNRFYKITIIHYEDLQDADIKG